MQGTIFEDKTTGNLLKEPIAIQNGVQSLARDLTASNTLFNVEVGAQRPFHWHPFLHFE